MPQRPATSFDEDLKSIREDFEADLSSLRSATSDNAERPAQSSSKHPVLDFGIGLVKSPLATISGGANLLRKVPFIKKIDEAVGSIPLGSMVPEAQGDAQWWGKRTGDVLTALPGAALTKGAKVLPRLAAMIERKAVPGLGKDAEKVLEMGRGVVSKANAAELQKIAAATPTESATQIQRFGRWIPKTTGPSKMQPAADAMTAAANAPMRPPSWPELGAMVGSGGLLHSWPLTAAVGAGQMLRRPLPSSMIAQAMHSTAPLVQGSVGAAITGAAQSLLRGEARDPKRDAMIDLVAGEEAKRGQPTKADLLNYADTVEAKLRDRSLSPQDRDYWMSESARIRRALETAR